MLEFTSVMLYYSQVKNVKLLSDLAKHATTTTEKIMNGIFVLTDTSLAITLVILLSRNRSLGFRTDTIVKRLIAYTLSTR